MRIPKIRYRKDLPIIEINKSNMFNLKTFGEITEHFDMLMGQVRQIEDEKHRLSTFVFDMSMTLGNWIDWDSLQELLEWLDLSVSKVEESIQVSKNMGFWDVDCIMYEWYLELKRDAYYGRQQ